MKPTSVKDERIGTQRTAVTVMESDVSLMLCPFFGKCDGLLVIDGASGGKELHRNGLRTADGLCEVVLASRSDRLICGFIAEPEKRRLRVAGVDIRLGACTCSVDELVAQFGGLPKA